MKFNLLNTIILIGIVQGFAFGLTVVLTKKYRWPGTLFLAALIVVFSLSNLQYCLMDIGLFGHKLFFSRIFVPWQLLMSPLLFYYVLKSLQPKKPLTAGNKLLLLPFAIATLLMTVLKFTLPATDANVDNFFDPIEGVIEFCAIGLFQSVLAYLWIMASKMQWRQENSQTDRKQSLKWHKNVVAAFFVISILWLCVALLSYGYDFQNLYYLMWLIVSVMIYWLGYAGIYRHGIRQERIRLRHSVLRDSPDSTKSKNSHVAALEKMLVAEKRFLDPTLTLDEVAGELNLSKSHLSRIINSELGKGFPDYLNGLRVEEAKSYLTHPEFENYTLVAIGLEAGFNSKTTFNTAFKKLTSLTPSEFRERAAGSRLIDKTQ